MVLQIDHKKRYSEQTDLMRVTLVAFSPYLAMRPLNEVSKSENLALKTVSGTL